MNGQPEGAGAAVLREADVQDELAAIGRARSRTVLWWTVLVIIAGVTLFMAPAEYAVLPLLPFLTFKRAMLRYEQLGVRRQALLEERGGIVNGSRNRVGSDTR